ncbi:ATP-binding protein [Spiroplasma endosymbiont of Megaselia nigra]|uniref:ATP-binding protein n=1 Tax=Spiroplasma endosymbiont of Megaselia nigra TaxID=2478537 RepID=UPI000F866813|nr:ATP-binding protein [Spiroplasma endosymbiont of Megaselia nigra]RUO86687.1 hypothetical protein D9R21_01580 [Spiroplasma endosymbiont of Megaselia nigra]
MKTHDLNIGAILEWDISFALREIISNAIDEQKYTKTDDIIINQISSDTWIIRDFGRGISQEHFILNENPEKIENNMSIGKFCVGLKDAFATLYRNNVDIKFKSNNGYFSITKLPKSDFKEQEVLHVVINDIADREFKGTEFTIKGITEKDMNLSKNLFLKYSNDQLILNTEYGQILEKKGSGSSIYVNGIKIATEEYFAFIYNIQPVTDKLRKLLNRERESVGRTAYSPLIQKILLSTVN